MTDSKYCNIANDHKSTFDVLLISHKIFSILHESCALNVETKKVEYYVCRLESPAPIHPRPPQKNSPLQHMCICTYLFCWILCI